MRAGLVSSFASTMRGSTMDDEAVDKNDFATWTLEKSTPRPPLTTSCPSAARSTHSQKPWVETY
eukprot:7203129-Pyramimonas_sp.AAC.1